MIQSIAYLGPSGSYSELALKEHLNPTSATSSLSIAEVFARVARSESEFGFVPIENVLQGPVSETLDSLLRHQGEVAIVCTFLSKISHALGVLPREQFVAHEILRIQSHEQALRQCAGFLQKTFPHAELQATTSTGAAAERIARERALDSAVVAAKATLVQNGFQIVAEDIADSKDNKTRFALITKGAAAELALAPDTFALLDSLGIRSSGDVTSIALRPGRDRQGILFEVLQIISHEHQINLVSIHSRPDERGVFAFHFDLEGHLREPRIQACLEALERYCRQSTKSIADVIFFGSYPQQRFYEIPFRSVGIIGGNGVMGRWFSEFFNSVGLEVLVSDQNSGLSVRDLAARAEVIVLSVPMSAFPEVVATLIPELRAGQLVVENSSIKSCALPTILAAAPESVEVLGIHTMFGGTIENLREQNVIVTQTASSGSKAQALEDLLYKFGAKITHADIATHDQKSAYLQSLMQATLVALAETMRETFSTVDELEPFSTPNSRNILESMRRVLAQSDNLLADLQRLNAHYPGVRRQFLQNVFQLLTDLEHGTESFLASAQASRRFLGRDES